MGVAWEGAAMVRAVMEAAGKEQRTAVAVAAAVAMESSVEVATAGADHSPHSRCPYCNSCTQHPTRHRRNRRLLRADKYSSTCLGSWVVDWGGSEAAAVVKVVVVTVGVRLAAAVMVVHTRSPWSPAWLR